ncbi:hypothetical protein PR202_ga05560 [Eleusine coracana subsp. coracana]|uniref:Uncharacterized protein n=1 Tax=Eleusine coracana subsp. coracana TaxID=191504 RepID=A0AAV5BTR2_ELECO|nr:hypothetical protein PR202_ga05107 [Eleusine coracana subsp. coracana]GJM89372.1 hypothetical protein PR202_ga05560 [Eleusine coracana subsp. coracana]
MERSEIATAARHFAGMARIVGPVSPRFSSSILSAPAPLLPSLTATLLSSSLRVQDPKAVKMRRHAFHLHQSGSTTLSASAVLLPRGALAEPPPPLGHLCAAHGHVEGDVALTAASLIEPFLIAEQRNNPGEELNPRLVAEARLDVLVEHEELGNSRDVKSGDPRWLSARLLAVVDVPASADSVLSLLKHEDSLIGSASWDLGWSLAGVNQKQVENDIRSSLEFNRNSAPIKSMDPSQLANSATRIAVLGIPTITANLLLVIFGQRDQNARHINVSVTQHRGDSLLIVGSPFGIMSPFHFLNRLIIIYLCSLSSISVGAVSNCLPPGTARSSLLMADIHCLPGMEGAPVFDKKSCLVGLLMQPLRQRASSIEVQLVITWDAICIAWNSSKLEKIGRPPSELPDDNSSVGPLDVALLQMEKVPNELNAIRPEFVCPTAGSSVYVVGHGLLGPRAGLSSSLSTGVVSKIVNILSAQHSHLTGTMEFGNRDIPVMLQTTAAVHPGASGGALINSQGLMIGLITSNAKHGGGSTIPHLNFSIPCKPLEMIFAYSGAT